MKLLSRYLLREHLPPFAFALGALTGLMLLNQVARQFSQLVGKGLPWGVILEVFGLSVPFIVAMTLPMAVLVAVLYAFVRLGADNEITALRASGVNLVALVRPVLLASLGLAIVAFLFIDQVLPPSNHKLKTLLVDIARKRPTFELKEQMVNEVIPQQFFLRAGRIDQSTDRLKDVQIYDLSSDQRRRTIYADSGYMRFNATRTDLWLTLFDGYVFDQDRTQPAVFRRVFFHTDLVRKRGISNTLERTGEDIGRGDREMSVCEMRTELGRHLLSLAALRREREATLGNDVRTLLGVTPLPQADTTGMRPERSLEVASLYCGALGGLGRLLRPRAAHAQQPPPRPAPVPAVRPPAASLPAAVAGYRITIADSAGNLLRLRLADLDARRVALRQMAARYQIEIHKKFAIAAACLVFVVIGAPVALRFPRGGVGLVIGASVLIFGFYYVGLIGGETLADALIVTPFWAMWGANLLMTAIGLVFFLRLNRQRVAARGVSWRERIAVLGRRRKARRA
ncbi:MAG TPA: LptF/LptG family permease [Gemmatimonadales bacterium]|nr:LptF/LptG family permease [Gemmatimonadales bacterium]